MVIKKCKICEQIKTISKYYKMVISKKGIQLYDSYCQDCRLDYSKNWVNENREHVNKTHREYADKNRPKLAEYKARHRKLHPDRAKARNAITMKLAKLRLTPLPCATCQATPTQAHHKDYSKPLEVTWLCRKHHLEAHNKVQRIELREEAADVRAV